MMKRQSKDFNLGYLFSLIERRWIGLLRCGGESYEDKILIPKIWFGLRSTKLDTVKLSDIYQNYITMSLMSIFKDIAPEWDLLIAVTTEQQFIRFDYTIHKIKVEKRKMTLDDIEKELGYEVEII